jgi:hypothetical protein
LNALISHVSPHTEVHANTLDVAAQGKGQAVTAIAEAADHVLHVEPVQTASHVLSVGQFQNVQKPRLGLNVATKMRFNDSPAGVKAIIPATLQCSQQPVREFLLDLKDSKGVLFGYVHA